MPGEPATGPAPDDGRQVGVPFLLRGPRLAGLPVAVYLVGTAVVLAAALTGNQRSRRPWSSAHLC